MITLDPPEFYGYTIFCDDIRQEAGGKGNFVGVYGPKMFVHGGFPALLPKFGVAINYNQKKELVVLPVKFWIFLPGDDDDQATIEIEAPEQGAKQAIQNAEIQEREMSKEMRKNHPSYVHIGFQTVFSPFIIPTPGLLRVRALRGDYLVRLGTLAIAPAPAESQS